MSAVLSGYEINAIRQAVIIIIIIIIIIAIVIIIIIIIIIVIIMNFIEISCLIAQAQYLTNWGDCIIYIKL